MHSTQSETKFEGELAQMQPHVLESQSSFAENEQAATVHYRTEPNLAGRFNNDDLIEENETEKGEF